MGNEENESLFNADGTMRREAAGREVTLTFRIGYPGSKVSDLVSDGHIVQIKNEALRAAMKGT